MSFVETKPCPMCGVANAPVENVCTACGESLGRGTSTNALLGSARREMFSAAAIWLIALVWSIGYCANYGYHLKPEELTFVLGFPEWIFWGVVLPWGLCTVISGAFAFGFMQDADLGDTDDSPLSPENADAAV